MKKLHIFASLWVMGFPLPSIFTAPPQPVQQEKIIRNSDTDLVLTISKEPDSGNRSAGVNGSNNNNAQPEIVKHPVTDTPIIAQQAVIVPVIPSACSAEKLREVLEPATASASTVTINCNLTLQSTDVVTKRLIFEGDAASGLTFNGNGATLNGGEGTINYKKDMIEVRSKSAFSNGTRTWQRPRNIIIKNCNIIGSVRIWGMAKNGQGTEYTDNGIKINYYKNSSRTLSHTSTARNNAPTNIVLDNVTITGVGRNPLYFAPGVTYSKLINSEMKGESDAVAIYLDAESYRNTIKNNYIHTVTGNEVFEQWDKPLVAIDGSSYNDIMDNRFSSLNHGGIYLYRNCGEGGVIRHAAPAHNRIINNVFYYNVYQGSNPAVYLSSKNAEFLSTGGVFGFCGDDDGYNFGSSASNLDYARYNQVMQNQIYKRSVGDMIRTKNPAINTPNYVDHNQTVTAETKRLAGCYVPTAYGKDFILHGESVDLFKNSNGEPVCTGYRMTCTDGDITISASTACNVSKVGFDCKVTGNNNGCRKIVACRPGEKIIGAKGAANLEFGSVSDNDLLSVPANTLKVVRPSDAFWAGNCFIDNTSLSLGEKSITGIQGRSSVIVGCKEYDDNGGDCDIRGILYCRGDNSTLVIPGGGVIIPPVEVSPEKVVIANRNAPMQVEENNEFGVAILPNPSKQHFNIQIQGSHTSGQVSIRVFDVSGRLVEEKITSTDKTVILGDKYLPGMYIIETRQGTDRRTMKVVKQ